MTHTTQLVSWCILSPGLYLSYAHGWLQIASISFCLTVSPYNSCQQVFAKACRKWTHLCVCVYDSYTNQQEMVSLQREPSHVWYRSITCYSVWVIVPSLLCNIEDSRDHCSGPTGQFAATQTTKRRLVVVNYGRRREKLKHRWDKQLVGCTVLMFLWPYHVMISVQLRSAIMEASQSGPGDADHTDYTLRSTVSELEPW